jgi:hypothetical protein
MQQPSVSKSFPGLLWYKTLSRAVASMSGEDVGKKFPNDEKKFQIFHGIESHKGVCYPEN